MKIIVCIKQVPGTNNVKVDPNTGTLIRDGIASKMNPNDLNALELALKLKEKYTGSVSVISMGPPASLAVIREAIYMGVDDGILLSDRKFGGADVLATSYTLAEGIKTIGEFDLILTGKQTIDGDTAQVGAELAEHLHIPHVSNVRGIRENGQRLEYVAHQDNQIVTALINKPCLMSADSDINTPRLPSFKRKQLYGDCASLIKTITFNDVEDKDENHYGLKGSATQVEKIFEPAARNDKKIITEGDLSQEVYQILKTGKFI